MMELNNYINDPKNAMYNFTLGRWYEDQGHTAAAASFYVRTTEYSNENLLIYEALLRLGAIFTRQGSRVFLTKGLYLRAISLMPDRPEAYFLLSQCYEQAKDWQEAYAFASMGEKKFNVDDFYGANFKPIVRTELFTNVGYPGLYGFTFERAVAAWWIGLWDESLYLLRQLQKNPNMYPAHVAAVNNNLRNLGSYIWKDPIEYNDTLYERLKVKFPGASEIKKNYSQCYQDMFVLTILNGKRDGKWLEVGCGDPFYGNNTALLEEWGWSGISVDIDPSVNNWIGKRKTIPIVTDATKEVFLLDGNYDYLQIDCDPALNSLEALFKIPFEKHKFAVITFEHDEYIYPGIQDRSRKYLNSLGYKLIAGNIAPDKYCNFEDWWIHPDLTDGVPCDLIKSNDNTLRADLYMLNK